MEFLVFAGAAFLAGLIVLATARGSQRLLGFVLFLIAGGLFVASMVRPVEAGTVQIVKIFGRMQPEPLTEGLNFVVPWAVTEAMSIRQQQYDFASAETAVSPSLDGVPLSVDVMFTYKLNPQAATRIYTLIGPDRIYRDQFGSIARSAIRDEVARRPWQEAALEGRDALQESIRLRFAERVRDNLQQLGFTETEAVAAFDFPVVQLRKILPPERVLTSISEKVSAEEDLKRQRTLTAIAEEEAKRRANEGLGVKKLFEELPDNYTPADIAVVLQALADKQRADALLKAVETGQVSVIVTEGGSAGAALGVR